MYICISLTPSHSSYLFALVWDKRSYNFPRTPGLARWFTHINSLGFMFLGLRFSTIVLRFVVYAFRVRVLNHVFKV